MLKKLLLLIAFCLCFLARVEAASIEIINVDASEEDINDVYDAVQVAEQYMSENFPEHALIMNVKIYVSTSEQPNLFSLSELKSDRVGGRSKMGLINVITSGERKGYRLKFLTVHELIHQHQASVLGGMQSLKKNMWLTEGMADILALHILDNPEMNHRFLYNAKMKIGEQFTLGQITPSKGWNEVFHTGRHPYAKAGLACEYLYQNFPTENFFKVIEELPFRTPDEALQKVYGFSIHELESYAGLTVDDLLDE